MADLEKTRTPNDPTVEAVGQLLRLGTLAVLALVGAGTLLVLAEGRRPLVEPGPAFDPARMIPDALALRPSGLLWLGLALTVMLPAARVVLALLGFARERDLRAAAVAVGILGVLALSVAVAIASARG